MAQPSLVVGTANNTNGALTVSPAIPAGASIGDNAFAVWVASTGIFPTVPAGWVAIVGPTAFNSNTDAVGIYQKVGGVNTGDPGATVNFTLASSRCHSAVIFTTNGTFDAVSAVSNQTTNQATNTVPAITPAQADCLWLEIAGIQNTTTGLTQTNTQPAGWTKDNDSVTSAGALRNTSTFIAHLQLVGQAGVAQTATSSTPSAASASVVYSMTIAPSVVLPTVARVSRRVVRMGRRAFSQNVFAVSTAAVPKRPPQATSRRPKPPPPRRPVTVPFLDFIPQVLPIPASLTNTTFGPIAPGFYTLPSSKVNVHGAVTVDLTGVVLVDGKGSSGLFSLKTDCSSFTLTNGTYSTAVSASSAFIAMTAATANCTVTINGFTSAGMYTLISGQAVDPSCAVFIRNVNCTGLAVGVECLCTIDIDNSYLWGGGSNLNPVGVHYFQDAAQLILWTPGSYLQVTNSTVGGFVSNATSGFRQGDAILAESSCEYLHIENCTVGHNSDSGLCDSKAAWALVKNNAVQSDGGRAVSEHCMGAEVASRTVTDGVTNSDLSFVSAGGQFSSIDVGVPIVGAGIPNGTTIATVTNATTVVLSAATTATATAVTALIGTGLPVGGRGPWNGLRSIGNTYYVNNSSTLSGGSTECYQAEGKIEAFGDTVYLVSGARLAVTSWQDLQGSGAIYSYPRRGMIVMWDCKDGNNAGQQITGPLVDGGDSTHPTTLIVGRQADVIPTTAAPVMARRHLFPKLRRRFSANYVKAGVPPVTTQALPPQGQTGRRTLRPRHARYSTWVVTHGSVTPTTQALPPQPGGRHARPPLRRRIGTGQAPFTTRTPAPPQPGGRHAKPSLLRRRFTTNPVNAPVTPTTQALPPQRQARRGWVPKPIRRLTVTPFGTTPAVTTQALPPQPAVHRPARLRPRRGSSTTALASTAANVLFGYVTTGARAVAQAVQGTRGVQGVEDGSALDESPAIGLMTIGDNPSPTAATGQQGTRPGPNASTG